MADLAVKIDTVAALRRAGDVNHPDPVAAALLAEMAGADAIVCRLQEDRRHIQERDLLLLRKTVQSKLILEMATSSEMVGIALEVRPDQITLVPENAAITTANNGLDFIVHNKSIEETIGALQNNDIPVGVLISPEPDQIKMAHQAGADIILSAWSVGHISENELRILRQAQQRGVLVVGSAGNFAEKRDMYPAAADDVLAVTALDKETGDAGRFNLGLFVDLAAPEWGDLPSDFTILLHLAAAISPTPDPVHQQVPPARAAASASDGARRDARGSLPLMTGTACAEQEITFFGAVPTMFQRLLDAFPAERPPSLRFLFTAGAAIPVPTIRAYEKHGVVLKQGFGQTETSILCSLGEEDAIRKAGSATGQFDELMADTLTQQVVEQIDAKFQGNGRRSVLASVVDDEAGKPVRGERLDDLRGRGRPGGVDHVHDLALASTELLGEGRASCHGAKNLASVDGHRQ